VGLDQRADLADDPGQRGGVQLAVVQLHVVKKSIRLTKRQEKLTFSFVPEEEDVAAVTTPEQFKALGHPMRHRLLFVLGQGEATISQLAAALGSNKGNIAHHLKVLTHAGLVRPAGTRQVRGGTERYYRRAHRALKFHDAAITEVAFSAIAAEIATAEPEPFLVMRTLRLNPEHAERIAAAIRDLAGQQDDVADDSRYGLLLGFYRPGQP
jgi:DNA-binding transcriptional ArsR family regulator